MNGNPVYRAKNAVDRVVGLRQTRIDALAAGNRQLALKLLTAIEEAEVAKKAALARLTEEERREVMSDADES